MTTTSAGSRTMRIDGDRHVGATSLVAPPPDDAVLAYALVPGADAAASGDVVWLGDVAPLVRPLRALRVLPPLLLPFGRRAEKGVREITSFEPRMTRLWERFSVDVPVSVERSAAFLAEQAFTRPVALGGRAHRILVLEDGDRYAMRALCMFTAEPDADGTGRVLELLHDRSVTGMRAASHLLGLAVRALADANAERVQALSLTHSGSFPMLVRHGFLPLPSRVGAARLRFGVIPLEPELGPLVTRREHWYLSGLDLAR